MNPEEDHVYIGAIDQGTTSTRFIVFNIHGKIIESHQQELQQLYPHPGFIIHLFQLIENSWVEHDPQVILSAVHSCIDTTISKMNARNLDSRKIKCNNQINYFF